MPDPLDGHGDPFAQTDYSRTDIEEENSSRREEENRSDRAEEETSEPEETRGSSLLSITEEGGGAYTVSYPGHDGEGFRSPPRRSENKDKVGFTFRKSMIGRLGSFQAVLKLKGEEVPKGEIVEAALDLFLREWELNGEESRALEWLRQAAE